MDRQNVHWKRIHNKPYIAHTVNISLDQVISFFFKLNKDFSFIVDIIIYLQCLEINARICFACLLKFQKLSHLIEADTARSWVNDPLSWCELNEKLLISWACQSQS